MSITEKILRAPHPIEIGGRTLKRYHITTFEAEIEPGIRKAAWDIVPELAPQPDDETPPTGWLVRHTGATGAYLCAYSWVWDNVVEMQSAVAGEPYLGCPDTNPEHVGVLEPDLPDLTGYISDTLPAGRTGGAK